MEIEAREKAHASIQFFVIDELTRAIASMLEITELIMSGERVVLVICDIEEGAEIAGEQVRLSCMVLSLHLGGGMLMF